MVSNNTTNNIHASLTKQQISSPNPLLMSIYIILLKAWYYYLPLCTDKEMKTQRGEVTYPRSNTTGKW